MSKTDWKVCDSAMKYFEKHPFAMIVIGVFGISLSSIFVKYSPAPSSVTAAWRLLWTVILMSPVVLGKQEFRRELTAASRSNILLSCFSGVFLAIHFALWFESLRHTSVASSTTIVCTEVIWVCLGYCILMKGRMSVKEIAAIGVTLAGSVLIALSDSNSGGSHLYGDILSLLAAIAVAIYVLIGRIVRKTASTTVYTYIVYSSCAAVLLAMCLINTALVFVVTVLAIVAVVAVQVLSESLALSALCGVLVMILGGAIPWKQVDENFASGIRLMGMIAMIMLVAGGYAEVMKATGAVNALVEAAVVIMGGSKWVAAVVITLIGLLVTMGIGSSFSTVPVLAVLYVPLCSRMGFSPAATILLMSAAAALGDAGSPASDTTLGPTSGLNADGQHDHIWDTCVPTFLHFNIPLMLVSIVVSQFI